MVAANRVIGADHLQPFAKIEGVIRDQHDAQIGLFKADFGDDAIAALKPKSVSAHTACSREEPQPKLARATRIDAPLKRGSSST